MLLRYRYGRLCRKGTAVLSLLALLCAVLPAAVCAAMPEGPAAPDEVTVAALRMPTGTDGGEAALALSPAARRQVFRRLYDRYDGANAPRLRQPAAFFAPAVAATLVDALALDVDGDGNADPGDRIRYTAAITNSGADDATGVTFTLTPDANTALDAASVLVSPLAFDDAYTAVGNTRLTATMAQGVLGNDVKINGAGYDLTVGSAGTLASDNGGSVTLAADGSFTYDPPVGFTGADTFTYTLGDGSGLTTTGTVTVTVSDVVWYVDDGAAGGGNGTSEAPFNTLAPLTDAADPDGANHYVYVFEGSYADGITLEAGQRLVGQGSALVVGGETLVAAGGVPTVGGTVTLATDNTVSGLNVSTTGAGIQGSNFGTATLSDVSLTATAGAALDLTNGTLTATLGTVSSTNSTTTGLNLVDVAGSLSATGGTISGATTAAVNLAGGTADVTLPVNLSNTAGRLVSVASKTGGAVTFSGTLDGGGTGILVQNNTTAGSITFSGATKTLSTGANAAVTLSSNAVPVHFTGGGLDITTTSGNGFTATGGGTLTVTGTGNTIETGTGQIVNIADVSAGAGGIAFSSLSSTGTVSGNAIQINNLDANGFDGGTVAIAGASGDGIHVSGGSSTSFTFGTTTINGVAGDGIEINASSGSFTVTGGNIGNTDDPAGRGVAIVGGTGAVDIDAGLSKATAGHVVYIDGHTTGTVNLGGNITASGGVNNGIQVLNSTSGGISFTGQTIFLATATNTAINLSSNGSNTVDFALTAGGNGLDISNAGGQGIVGSSGGVLTVTGSGNTISSGAATALNVQNTTIGAAGLTFASISVNGAANGIILNNTGSSGGLTVSGSGTTVGSGGTITNTSGAGISLTSTANVSLNGMIISHTASHGVSGTGVTNVGNSGTTNNSFSFTNGLLDSPGDGDNDSALYFDELSATNITGRMTVSGTTIQNFEDVGVHVGNSSGSLVIDVTNTVFDNNSDSNGEEGIDVDANGTAYIQVNVTGTPTGTPDNAGYTSTTRFVNLEGGPINGTVHNSGTIDVNISNTLATGTGGPDEFPTPPSMTFSAEGSSSTMNLDIINNRLAGSSGDGIFIGHEGTINASITGNTIDDMKTGDGIRIDTDALGTATATILIQNNRITNVGDDGIQILHRDGNKTLNLTVDGNIIQNTRSEGIRVFVDDDVSGGGPLARIAITNNTFGSNNTDGFGGYTIHTNTQDPGTVVNLNITGNTYSGVNTFNTFLGQASSSTLTITQSSTAAMEAANPGMAPGFYSGTITFNTPVTVPQPVASLTMPLPGNEQIHQAAQHLASTAPVVPAQETVLPAEVTETTAPETLAVSEHARLSGLLASAAPVALPVAYEPGIDRSALFATTGRAALYGTNLAAAPVVKASAAAPGDVEVTIGTLPAGKTATIQFDVTVDNPLAAGVASVSAQGTVSGTNFTSVQTDDVDTGTAGDATTTTVAALPDVTLALVDAPDPVTPGATLAYTLTYDNTGNQDAAGVVLHETVPTGTTLDAAASTTGWTCADHDTDGSDTDAGSTCTFTVGSVPVADAAANVTFAVTVVRPAAAALAEISNTASATRDGLVGNDAEATVTTTLDAAAALAATKADAFTLDEGTANAGNPGDEITYTVTVANSGDRDATDVTITDVIPTHTTYVAGSATLGGAAKTDASGDDEVTYDGGTNTLSVAAGTVPGNDGVIDGTAVVTFRVRVNGPLPAGVTEVSNQASVTATNVNGGTAFSTDDPDTGTAGDATATPLDPVRLVVNEFDYNDDTGASGEDLAEFVEIRNVGAAAVDLAGYALRLVRETGGTAEVYRTIRFFTHTLQPGDYYVVCGDKTAFVGTDARCDLDESDDTGGPTALPDADLIQDIDATYTTAAVALVQGTLVVDAVSYGGTAQAPYAEGTGLGTDDGTGFVAFSRYSTATSTESVDTDANSADFVTSCATPGRANTPGTDACTDPLPVELTSFTATSDGAAVVLAWETASETNNAGFDVEYRAGGSPEGSPGAAWQRLGFVEGAGTAVEARRYSYRAADLAAGVHRFRLKQIDYDGAFTYSPEVEVTVEVPRALVLEANYPNPFNPQTKIAFTVPEAGEASVRVYDVLGREVATLFEGAATPGQRYELTFEAGANATGVYVYVLEYGGQRIARRMLLVK